MSFKIGSLFDGSGGFPLAAFMCDGIPVWASEIEPYPIAVTKTRFPYMKHLGSVTDIKGDEVEPVDVITFGSPCQDLSVAGKRAGLKHIDNGDEETTRSGLFMEAVRIIKEMKEATNGVYPRFALWENVPGAFSSNKGEDFRIVLEELIKINEPSAVMPPVPKNGWPYSDCYCGDGWSIAYRVLDAQYWGVPQRRRRIYLVLDLGGQRAGEVLSERESLRGYFEEGRAPWQSVAGDAENCPGTANCEGVGLDICNLAVTGDVAASLTTATGQGASNTGSSVCIPVISINGEVAATLDASYYKGCGMRQGVEREVVAVPAFALDQQVIPIHDQATRFSGKHGDKSDGKGNGLGVGDIGDPMNTLTSGDRHAVVYCTDIGFFNSQENVSPTLLARQYKDPHLLTYPRKQEYIVRRITPTECARLQGFPDGWGHPDKKNEFTDEEYAFWLNVRNTHAAINDKPTKEYTREQMLKWYNKLHTDSSEYKMWGNGIALPTALYVMQGIAEVFAYERD